MALTIANNFVSDTVGGARIASFTVTFDNVYLTGGMTCDLSTWFGGSPDLQIGGDDGYVGQTDRGTAAANKILLYEAGADAAALDQVANATDTSGVIIKVLAMGTKAL